MYSLMYVCPTIHAWITFSSFFRGRYRLKNCATLPMQHWFWYSMLHKCNIIPTDSFYKFYFKASGKSLLESWVTTFLPNWQPSLIFVWFTSKSHEHYPHYKSTCKRSLRLIWQRLRVDVACYSGRKVVTHNSKSDLPLYSFIYFC